jgi:hypothetical protein
LDKSKARLRRLQNSPETQTVVIADLEFILSHPKDFVKIPRFRGFPSFLKRGKGRFLPHAAIEKSPFIPL